MLEHHAIVPNPWPGVSYRNVLARFRREDAAATVRVDISPRPAAVPPPWPIDFDLPRFPRRPGANTKALRAMWYEWGEAWDDVAAGMEVEQAAMLWSIYDKMKAAGVTFDPAFAEAFDRWRQEAAIDHDADHEDDMGDRCLAGDDCGTRGGVL